MHAHPEQPSRPHFLHTAGRGGRTSNNGGGRWRDGESLESSPVDELSSSSSRREAWWRGGNDSADFRPGQAMYFLGAWLATGACFFLSASASCFLLCHLTQSVVRLSSRSSAAFHETHRSRYLSEAAATFSWYFFLVKRSDSAMAARRRSMRAFAD
ncbi:hypothetical protein DFH08DRAFT_854583 [Mycena albidolilacea]|uniref:Uncharacterized protein n=1 Tax=Mycena albidolilacea TaxID=1033008 RepID=A0AAD7EXB9_9AGAR|nr:hypothetical protein DFH08DRAFT_854583 [Mycena albidolilacea]